MLQFNSFMKHCIRCTMNTILQGKLDPAPLPCTDNAYKLLTNAEKTKTPCGRVCFFLLLSGYMDLILRCLGVNIFKLASVSVSGSYSSPHFAPDDTTMTDGNVCLNDWGQFSFGLHILSET